MVVDAPILWQAGYAAFAVEQASITTVSDYVESQREHHRSRTALLALELPPAPFTAAERDATQP